MYVMGTKTIIFAITEIIVLASCSNLFRTHMSNVKSLAATISFDSGMTRNENTSPTEDLVSNSG